MFRPNPRNTSGSDPARPAGCSATGSPTAPLDVAVFFNHLANSSAGCGAGAQVVAGAADSLVYVPGGELFFAFPLLYPFNP